MLEYIVLLGLVVAVTVALLCLGAAGTKETSFEDALAEQRKQRQKEGGNSKSKKPKAAKKVRPARPRTTHSNGAAAAAAPRSASTGHESAGTTTEDDNHEEHLLAAHRRQQEQKRQQADQQRQQAEEQRKQAEQQKLQAEQQKQQAEQQKLEREKQEREAQQEQQKQREREAQQQEEERQQKHQQQILEQHKQQEVADQESKRNEKKKKLLRNDEAKQKQQKTSKSGVGMVNGVHLENAVSVVASNGMTVDGPSLRMNGKRDGDKISKKSVARLQELSASREEVVEKVLHNGTSSATAMPSKKNKKQKSDKTINVQTILQTVEEAQLSSDQLQQVVDSLLAVAADGGWSEARKGVEVAVTKKLEEANSTIARQQEAQSALTVKISDLRTDLNSERSKSTQLRKQLEAAVAEQQRLVERDQQMQLQHKQQMQQSINQQAAQQIQEERVRLQREYDEKIRQGLLSSPSRNYSPVQAGITLLFKQGLLACSSRDYSPVEAGIIFPCKKDWSPIRAQFAAEQLSRAKGELETRMQGAQQEIQQLSTAMEERTRLVHLLQQEKEALQEKVDEAARSAADCKEKSGDYAALELIVSNQAAELEQKKQQSESLSGDLSRLKTELESVKTKNNELREKNSSVLKAYQELEANLQAKEKKDDSAALENMEEGYRQLLIRLHPAVSVPASLSSSDLRWFQWAMNLRHSALPGAIASTFGLRTLGYSEAPVPLLDSLGKLRDAADDAHLELWMPRVKTSVDRVCAYDDLSNHVGYGCEGNVCGVVGQPP
ncbi:hypothetical protein FHG87_003329 [Trinorchestia longiramus]|nr:hypothetical protein FHG87_003329 [Trinorchestia longiramus]